MDPEKEKELMCKYGKQTDNSGSGLYFEKGNACDVNSRNISVAPGTGNTTTTDTDKDKSKDKHTTTTSSSSKSKDTSTTSQKSDNTKKYEDMTHVTSHADKSSHNYGLVGSTVPSSTKPKETTTCTTTCYTTSNDNKNLGSSSSSKTSHDNTNYNAYADTTNYNKNANLSSLTSSINSGTGVHPQKNATDTSQQYYQQQQYHQPQQQYQQPQQQYQQSQQHQQYQYQQPQQHQQYQQHQQSQQEFRQPQPYHQSQSQQPMTTQSHQYDTSKNSTSESHHKDVKCETVCDKKAQSQCASSGDKNVQCQDQSGHEHHGGKVTKGVFYAFTTTEEGSEDQRKSNSGIGAAHVPGKTSDQYQS